MSIQLEEADYDTRLGGYRRLSASVWASLPDAGAMALLQRSLRDLRDGSDLALRHAASQALLRFISTLSSSAHADDVGRAEGQEQPGAERVGDRMVTRVWLYGCWT